jgi:hypothetical protein
MPYGISLQNPESRHIKRRVILMHVSLRFMKIQLTPCITGVLEKLKVARVLRKFPVFYGTRRFITVFTKARKWSLSWEYTPSHPISLWFISIFFHLRISLPSDIFSSGCPTKLLYVFSSLSCMLHTHPVLFDRRNTILWRLQIIMKLIMNFFPFSCQFLPLRLKYSPNFVLKLRSFINVTDQISHPTKQVN